VSAPRPYFGALPQCWGLIFASGTNCAGEIEGTWAAGRQVGVSAPEVSDRVLDELEAGRHNRRHRLFVDTGAYSEKRTGVEITEAEWFDRLSLMDHLGALFGRRAYLVAPDRGADQQGTLERLRRYKEHVHRWLLWGANVILPLQAGERDVVAFAGDCLEALGGWHRGFVWGFPCRWGALPVEAMAALADHLEHGDLPLTRFHLLGLAPRGAAVGHPGRRFLRAFAELRRRCPRAAISSDSCRILARVGRTNGRGGGPRAYTAAQDLARVMGLSGPALKLDAIGRVYREEDARAARHGEAMLRLALRLRAEGYFEEVLEPDPTQLSLFGSAA
jgi:hypothetical protein